MDSLALDVKTLRQQFPALFQEVHGKPLVYLDNAATTHKPLHVLEAEDQFYRRNNSNIHRGVHTLSQRATEQYEQARSIVRGFLNAADAREIVFVRGTTEAINLVAHTYGHAHVTAGDEILISTMEHHSNIVPWQMLCEMSGASLKVIPITDSGEIEYEEFERLLSPKTKIVSIVHVSNALGTVNPVKQMIEAAHRVGSVVLVDGAQAVSHMPVDVRDLGCDFYAMSGHKAFAPTGIGALYGRLDILAAMPPYQGGGDMIASVAFERTTYAEPPARFEAGTPHIAGAVGLGAALSFIQSVGLDRIHAYEEALLQYGTQAVADVHGLRMVGTAQHKAGVLSFTMEHAHPHDIGTIVDMEGVAIRTGHHCAQPVMRRFGLAATARASLAFYNTRDDLDRLVAALHKVLEVFR